MTKDYFEVDVPIRNTEGLRGVHVFTGQADSDSAAIKAAHEVYNAARAAAAAGREIPHGRPDGWGACGYRPGWELDWPAAKAGPWKSPYSWLTRRPFEL
ncbi:MULTISPECIES: hypothetical protein [unclassified Streptomyces]|uniref:hypothetical protein n=1 Tax=unclassified Streptomyces TaxID=2593676 RepID=UPI002E308AC0|nr:MULTISPECIES: hypothetical protein [unclassified Streptomyces]WUC69250.1 hypothetical protein OG861_34000 [Streptomyces sp. NBC_00539]